MISLSHVRAFALLARDHTAAVVDRDGVLFQQPPDRALERLLAQAEQGADRLGVGLVADVGRIGMLEASTPTFTVDEDDAERLVALGKQLTVPASRELAYCVAFLLTVADVAIAPEEDELLDNLRSTLGLTEERADERAAAIGAAITPPS
jgi:hypothetical protein